MLDIKLLRKNPHLVKTACEKKGVNVDVDLVLELDKEQRNLLREIEDIRMKKNLASREIVKKPEEKMRIIKEMRKLNEREEKLAQILREKKEQFESLFLRLPNIPFDDVPVGRDEGENIVIKEVGERRKFDFKIRDHYELGESLDVIDVKRASKTSGSRFGFLKGKLVSLQFALLHYTFEKLLPRGFVPVIPPVMLKKEMARGTGYYEATDINEAYFLPQDNLFLVGTSEQSLIAMHANEIFREEELPKRYLGFSTCFRREAGSWGKDTRGIFRVHQFDKLEMISFCKQEDSRNELKFFLETEQALMNGLKLPYRVVHICTGDLGLPAAEKFDIETWFPGQNRYRETHSASNCTDFQARRLNIRYKGRDRRVRFVHTINGTAFALGRIILAIMENYQQRDGSIKVPEALLKYLNFKEIKNERTEDQK